MIDYAIPEKRKWLYSIKRKEMMLEATITSLVGVFWAILLFIGLGE